MVSWYDAISFCNLLSEALGLTPVYRLATTSVERDTGADGYRLPIETEWEHGCRAGNTQRANEAIGDVAWYAGNSQDSTHGVGQLTPNALGLHDMLGNVWEWVWPSGSQTESDGSGIEVASPRQMVFRGGCWSSPPEDCTPSSKGAISPRHRADFVGFRICRDFR